MRGREATENGYIHLSVSPQRLPYVVVQCIDDDVLTAHAEAGVPAGRFVKGRAPIAVSANNTRCAFGNISDGHGTNVVVSACSVLELLPDIKKKLLSG